MVERYGKKQALAIVRERTGFGWRVAERFIEQMAEQGHITLQPSLDLKFAWLITAADLEIVIARMGNAPNRS